MVENRYAQSSRWLEGQRKESKLESVTKWSSRMSGPRDLFPVVVVVVSGLLALNLSRQVEPSASRCNPTEHVSRRFVPLFADRPQFYEASLLSLFLSLSLSISLSLSPSWLLGAVSSICVESVPVPLASSKVSSQTNDRRPTLH